MRRNRINGGISLTLSEHHIRNDSSAALYHYSTVKDVYLGHKLSALGALGISKANFSLLRYAKYTLVIGLASVLSA
jgi:hypothetical protein